MTTINSEDGAVFSSGLASKVGFDLILPGVRCELEAAGTNLLRALVDYFEAEKRSVKAGDKIDWASSILIARSYAPRMFALDELDFDGRTKIVGTNNAIKIWAAQSAVCRFNKTTIEPCRFGSSIAVSPGVLESREQLEGIRYERRDGASGWWLFTPDYDGQVDEFASMITTHTFHVLRARRDVAEYLGLPCGFAFETATRRVWRNAEGV